MSTIICHFDGAYDWVTGLTSYGAVIEQDGRIVKTISQELLVPKGSGSCNVAEYAALVAVLRYLLARDLSQYRIVIRGDSQLVIRQMFGNWQIKDGRYVEYAKEAKKLLQQFPRITGKWVPRRYNYHADRLARPPSRPLHRIRLNSKRGRYLPPKLLVEQ
jgi:ribonuclease HI